MSTRVLLEHTEMGDDISQQGPKNRRLQHTMKTGKHKKHSNTQNRRIDVPSQPPVLPKVPFQCQLVPVDLLYLLEKPKMEGHCMFQLSPWAVDTQPMQNSTQSLSSRSLVDPASGQSHGTERVTTSMKTHSWDFNRRWRKTRWKCKQIDWDRLPFFQRTQYPCSWSGREPAWSIFLEAQTIESIVEGVKFALVANSTFSSFK